MHKTPEPASIRQLLGHATRRLNQDSARLDAEVLLACVLGQPRSHLHAWPERVPLPAARAQFEELLLRRAAGEPVAYLTGVREFWSLPLAVTRDTLIPRPETETLVTLALQKIPAGSTARIADLGTGSGAIALAIAHERPRCQIIATDLSAMAITVASRNARQLGITNVEFLTGNWCAPLTAPPFDLIVSNPPYIPTDDPHLDQGDARFEPRPALAAGPEGMDDLNAIAHSAREHLCSGGWLLLEHGYDQGSSATRLLAATGFREVADYTDDAGLSRVVAGRK
jgi:release factor glutamine methyltransferase